MVEATEPGPMSAVRQFVRGFNANDVDLAVAACEDATSITDDFPPHLWSGPGATRAWFDEMARLGPQYGMSEISVTTAEPRSVLVSDRQAYVVVPVEVRWRHDGAPAQRGGLMTLALRDRDEGWRITALTWTWD